LLPRRLLIEETELGEAMTQLRVDLEGVRLNSQAVSRLLRGQGIDLIAVTKACLGDPRVAQAMLDGGAQGLADTRNQNLRRLRDALPDAEIHRIYLAPKSGGFESCDICYVSSSEGVRAVARAGEIGHPRKIMFLLETGDLREGAPLEHLDDVVNAALQESRVEIEGIATNFACFVGRPEGLEHSVSTVVEAAQSLRRRGVDLPRVSAGNSSTLSLLVQGKKLPEEVTELRCGEAILLGQDAILLQAVPGCRQDVCRLRLEVVEEYTKIANGGAQRRLVLGAGSQDLGSGRLEFLSPGLREIGRSSDYTVVVATPGANGTLGDILEAIPGYGALVSAWTSPFVEVDFV